jgi:hypothetical protein
MFFYILQTDGTEIEGKNSIEYIDLLISSLGDSVVGYALYQ